MSVVLRSFRKKNLFSKKSVIQNCILFPTDSIKGFESRIQLGNRTSFRLQLWECKEKQNDDDDNDDDEITHTWVAEMQDPARPRIARYSE